MNGDTHDQAQLRRLRHESACYRCQWASGPVITIGVEFFAAHAAILALPVGESTTVDGGEFCIDAFTVTRTR